MIEMLDLLLLLFIGSLGYVLPPPPSLFSLCLDWLNSFVLSVCSLMVSSLISTLLLSQSSEFLIPVIAFFSSVISNLLFL